MYNGLHKNWPFAYFEKITVAVGWVYIKVWTIPHLKSLTPRNETFENIKVAGLLGMILGVIKLPKFQN